VVSTASDAVLDAIEAGAVEFVTKPTGIGRNMDEFINELIYKIKIAAVAKIKKLPAQKSVPVSGELTADQKKIVAIGASTGGTEAIFNLLKVLPPTLPGIVIVQHIPPVFSKLFSERLNTQTVLT
jgi:two-component system chemotaxis response regulator CheB